MKLSAKEIITGVVVALIIAIISYMAVQLVKIDSIEAKVNTIPTVETSVNELKEIAGKTDMKLILVVHSLKLKGMISDEEASFIIDNK